MDNKEDEEAFKEDLLSIARTTLSSKLLNVEKNHFAELAVDSVLRIQVVSCQIDDPPLFLSDYIILLSLSFFL